MCQYIGLDDLALNAFIEICDSEKNIQIVEPPVVTYSRLRKYGIKLVHAYKDSTQQEAELLISDAYISDFVRDYSGIIDVSSVNGEYYFSLLKYDDIEKIRELYRYSLPIDLINAFMDESVKEAILAA